MDIEEVAQFWS